MVRVECDGADGGSVGSGIAFELLCEEAACEELERGFDFRGGIGPLEGDLGQFQDVFRGFGVFQEMVQNLVA